MLDAELIQEMGRAIIGEKKALELLPRN